MAEPYQRQGIASQALGQLLEPWLSTTAQMQKVRLGVERFSPRAFFEHLGFRLTGEADRIKVGDKLVHLSIWKRRGKLVHLGLSETMVQ